ncbi:hypothetical protein PS623_04776 [Pseudomonas fluorescens]|nr:hypothetical protein PS623_04776 [Pseudomonas fluorescens]
MSVEAGHAAARVKPRHPRQAGVDHHPHAIDGQAGFGNVGRQHHLALAAGRRLDGSTLGVQVKLAVQRAEDDVGALADGFLQALMDSADLGLAGQKHQQAAALIGQRLQHAVDHPRLDELTRLHRLAPLDRYRVHAALAADHRSVVKQARQALAFEGCRHQQDFQRRLVAQ